MQTKTYRIGRFLGIFLLPLYPYSLEAEGILSELESLTSIRAQTHVTLRRKEDEKEDISRICTALQFSPFYLDNKIFEKLTKNLVATYFLLDVLEYLDKFPPFCSSPQRSEPIFPVYTKPGVVLLILDTLEQQSNPYIYSPSQVTYILHTMNCMLATTLSLTQGLGHGQGLKDVTQEYRKTIARIRTYRDKAGG